MGRIA
jgi:ribonuclease HI